MELSTLRSKTLALLKKTETAKRMYDASVEECAKNSKSNQDLNIKVWKDITGTLAASLRHALTLQKGSDLVGYLLYVLDEIKAEFSETEKRCLEDKASADDSLKKGDYIRLSKVSGELQVNHARATALLAAAQELQPLVSGFAGKFSGRSYGKAEIQNKNLSSNLTSAVVIELEDFKKKRRQDTAGKEGTASFLGQIVNFRR